IGALTGTSAGAINAAIVAAALTTGSPKRARASLQSFWLDVAYPANTPTAGEMWAPVERAWRESIGAWLLSTGTSPYQLNPLGINPLRQLIERHVDIEALRSPAAPRLYVTLTNVKTGLPRVVAMRVLARKGEGDVRIIDTRLHRIGPPPPSLLMMGSPLERSRQWLLQLHGEGRSAAKRFLARHSSHIGVRDTLDIARFFSGN